jgi:hypothetical protein
MVSEQAGTVGPGVWKVGACQAVVAVVTVLASKLVVVCVPEVCLVHLLRVGI